MISSIGATRLLGLLLFGAAPGDPATLVGVVIVFAGVAALACCVPARRVTRTAQIGFPRALRQQCLPGGWWRTLLRRFLSETLNPCLREEQKRHEQRGWKEPCRCKQSLSRERRTRPMSLSNSCATRRLYRLKEAGQPCKPSRLDRQETNGRFIRYSWQRTM